MLHAAAQYFLYIIGNDHDDFSVFTFDGGWEKGWLYWRIKFISVIILAIMTAYHIYSNRLANAINKTLAIIKFVILSIVAIVGLVRLPSVLNEHPNNWSNPFKDTRGFHEISFSFVLVCNTI